MKRLTIILVFLLVGSLLVSCTPDDGDCGCYRVVYERATKFPYPASETASFPVDCQAEQNNVQVGVNTYYNIECKY